MPYDIGRDGQAIFRSSPQNTNNTTPQITPNDSGGGFNGWWIFIPIMIIILVYFIYQSGNKNSSNPISTSTSSQSSVINRTGYISAKEYANIRNGPSTNYGIITKKYRGESVYVIEKDLATNWYKVSYDNNSNTGYVSNILISFDILKSNQQQTSTNTSNNNTSGNSNTINNKIHSLDGKWIKIGGWRDKGIVVSYANNIGTIISVPNTTSRYYIGEIEWKDYDPERNNLQFLVHLADGYLNTDVKFINSDKIKLNMSGDTYERQQVNGSLKSENVEQVNEVPLQSDLISKSDSIRSYLSENGTGMVSFWTTSSYGHKIYIDGIFYGSLKKYFTKDNVSCEELGTFSIILSEGKHTFIAKENLSEWSGSFIISPGKCQVIQVNKQY